MDPRDQRRPPRAVRPNQPSLYLDQPPPQPNSGGVNVSFQTPERPEAHRQRTLPSAYDSQPSPGVDPEKGGLMDPARVARKKSMVRPDREKIEPGHRQWHYRSHAAEAGGIGVMPSTTGNYPQREPLRRGRSLLGREEDVHESGLALFKRGATIRRRRQSANAPIPQETRSKGCFENIAPGPKDAWMIYCYLITCCIPGFMFKACGIRSPEQRRAWREKMGLFTIILVLMTGVGFLTFGFTESVCGTPPNRFHAGFIEKGSVIIHGQDYDFSNFKHPAAGNMFNGQTNPLFEGGWNVAGNDASFLFQKVNQNCLGMITKSSTSSITGSGNTLDWYFPCNVYNQYGTSGVNLTGYESGTNCHATTTARKQVSRLRPKGQVYYTWDDVTHPSRQLAVYESSVLDLSLLQWLNKAQVNYPAAFDKLMKPDPKINGKDLTMYLLRTNQRQLGACLQDIVTVGYIDTNSIGCVASSVVLYISLVFIIGVVAIRFAMAVMFSWFFSWKLGTFPRETYEQRMQRSAEIEAWSNDIYRPAPSQYRPNVNKIGLSAAAKANNRKTFLPSTSRFTPSDRPATTYSMLDVPNTYNKRATVYAPSEKGGKLSRADSPARFSRSTTSFGDNFPGAKGVFAENPCPFPLKNVVPQPPPDAPPPFNFPLIHTICLVTAYSESVEGLRTTLDSLATTDYPNSHKVILIVADGMVKGHGNDMTTPDICLSMMKDFVIEPQDVKPHSYVAIADGHKRHNMAKVYAGFYDYDDSTTERSKQQRVPMVLVAKCGNPREAKDPKPGNRGKRDSQIVLMAFLQKVMFDERMTTFEYEFFNSLWRVTGISPDRYETVLCVDADTKVFPDALTRMVSCMVSDEEIMGLCGETKVANKAETFVTMMQVFEYYISHHMTKAFESMFGGVTCLPGCFTMYRIKAPKGDSGYWVPILANPDIVEHYSENVVDTLHKKNLLLLGEDRYLTTLMLKTFPKRKNMFCPQAVCKTIVPDTFFVLLSQRRRWINSTIHNLAELLFVRDLCGTFCFSMQFIVAMELAGTLVLPAAICFTIYLIVRSAIPHHTSTTIPLILLGIVLGLPGLLIVITSKKVAYIGWMLVYLLSLPIWNGVLPAYAFWHFDDFSWGQTRQVTGDKAGHEGDKEGEFDSSHIVMKRWAEFERDRRWKSGTQSRDSTYYDRKGDGSRYSMISNSDGSPLSGAGFDTSTLESTNFSGNTRPRYDSNAVLMLPAPLAVTASPPSGSGTTLAVSRSSDENTHLSDGSHQRLLPSPQSGEAPLSTYDQPPSSGSSQTVHAPYAYEGQVSRSAAATPVLRNPSSDPFRNSYPILEYGDNAQPWLMTEPDESNSPSGSGTNLAAPRTRGVSLADNGPVPGPDGVRRVSRAAGRRPTSQQPPQNRYSRNSMYGNLPPGAAPPQPNYGG